MLSKSVKSVKYYNVAGFLLLLIGSIFRDGKDKQIKF